MTRDASSALPGLLAEIFSQQQSWTFPNRLDWNLFAGSKQDFPGSWQQDYAGTPSAKPADTLSGSLPPATQSRDKTALPTPLPAESVRLETATDTASASRVTLLDVPSSVTADNPPLSIRILDQPEQGHASVTPDLKIALVMSEAEPGTTSVGLRYEVTLADSSTVEVASKIALTPALQTGGWNLGDTYMLETDPTGQLVLEHGADHRKVHVTAGNHGLTAKDIAAAEGLELAKMEGKWGKWLKNHPEYGASEDKALNTELGMSLWKEISLDGDRVSSNWLLFERGYEYDKAHANRLIHRGSSGESELHPQVITAYGEGHDPVIGGGLNIYQELSANVVLHGIDLAGGAQALTGRNILLDKVSIGGEGGNFQKVESLTIRESDIVDIVHEEPVNDGPKWHPSLNRVGGIFVAGSTGVLIEDNLFDRNGWAEGYSHDLSTKNPMPPSYYNHNLYMSGNNQDVTIRDNIFLRGASFGAQARSGGFIEDNVFIDNNAALNLFGGDSKVGHSGNYSLVLDNLVTSAGHKRVAEKEGSLSMGIEDKGEQSALIGNIIAHLADPANPAEQTTKTVTHKALNDYDGRFHDDTIIYRWIGGGKEPAPGQNRGVDGLDPARLDQTTIQKFTAGLLSKPDATIGDLADHLRTQENGQLDGKVDADLINAFFRVGFGLDTTLRAEADTLIFIPDERGDGVRWDNRLNWSTGDLPGTQDGDSVDLGGNAVRFGSATVSVQNVDFGDFGKLSATSGKLTVDGGIAVGDHGGTLSIDRAGQVWINGYGDSDRLEISVAGGRFANAGPFAGHVEMEVNDNAQAILATGGGSFDLTKGSKLALAGSRISAGFDGQVDETAILRLHEGAVLQFVADEGGFATLSEFRSGAFGQAPQVSSAIRLDGTLMLDLSSWKGDKTGSVMTLLKADQIVGAFDDIEIIGTGADQDATVVIDYVEDEVRLLLKQNGSGSVDTTSVGFDQSEDWASDPAYQALWQALQAEPPAPSDNPLGA